MICSYDLIIGTCDVYISKKYICVKEKDCDWIFLPFLSVIPHLGKKKINIE